MYLRQYRPLVTAAVLALLFYILNRLFFLLPGYGDYYTAYHHPLELLYAIFGLCALIILFILITIHKKKPDSTGFAYMGLTLGQMAVGYILLRPILNSGEETASFEKVNFFVIFILFLAIETLITIRLLNKKQ